MAGAITKTIVDHFWLATRVASSTHTTIPKAGVGKRGEREFLVHLHNKTYLNIIIIRHRVAHAATQADAATAARAHRHQTTVRAFVDHEDLHAV